MDQGNEAIRAQIEELVEGTPFVDAAGIVGGPVLVCMADVEPEEIRWLWKDRIALGKLTLLVGDPGLGKSFVTLDMASRVSKGWPWPDRPGTPSQRGSVILLSAEDDMADTIRPRLDAMGADVGRVHVLKAVRVPKDNGEMVERMFCLQVDLEELTRAIRRVGDVRLCVVDPLTAYLGNIDSHRNSEIRGLLAPLSEVAAGHDVALVAVSHLNKSTGAAAMYRIMGSLGFAAAARAVWCVSRDKDNPERRLFLPIKNNIAKDTTGLAYALQDHPDHPGIAVVAWEPEPVTMTAEEALRDQREEEGDGTVGQEVETWLAAILTDGPVASKEIRELAHDNHYAWRTVERVKQRIGVEAYHEGFGKEVTWYWRLPGFSPPQEALDRQSQGMADYGESGGLRGSERETVLI